MSVDGRYKWVFDGDAFACVAETTQLSHGEIAEEHLRRPGAGAEHVDRGVLTLHTGVVRYEVYFSTGHEPAIEDAIRSWVTQLTGPRPRCTRRAPITGTSTGTSRDTGPGGVATARSSFCRPAGCSATTLFLRHAQADPVPPEPPAGVTSVEGGSPAVPRSMLQAIPTDGTFAYRLAHTARPGRARPGRASVRAHNTLRRAELATWPAIASATPLTVFTIPNLGAKTFLEMMEVLIVSWAALASPAQVGRKVRWYRLPEESIA